MWLHLFNSFQNTVLHMMNLEESIKKDLLLKFIQQSAPKLVKTMSNKTGTASLLMPSVMIDMT